MPGKRLIHVCILVSSLMITGCAKYEHCPPGLSWCWTECVDLMNDDSNCGSCDHECLPDSSCSAGVCEYEGCTTREDCAGSECLVCKDHECVPPSPVCYSDQDCCVGYNCNMGHCEAGGPGCASDDDCIDPEKPRCVDGRCEPAPTCTVESCQTGEWCDVSVGECLPGCDEDSDCEPPEICNFTAHQCINVGSGRLGDPCPYGNVNATAADCSNGLSCLGTEDWGLCPGGYGWECNGIPDVYNPDCVDGVCGFSVCAAECESPGECPDGFAPVNVNRTCYCFPFVDGSVPTGEPCPFGDVNPDAQYCYQDLECLGRPADGNSGYCPGGDPAECTEYPASQNPDCVNGVCGFSFCADRCDAQGNCPTGHEPLDADGTCYCAPGAVGNSQLGDPCPYGDVNATADYCVAGLECLGNDSAGDCPGGLDTECSGIADGWNPDCVDGICGFSFCATRCDAIGNCPTGYAPEDVNGLCYCIPSSDPNDG